MEERASSALQPLSSVLMQGEENGKGGGGGVKDFLSPT